MTPIQRTFKYGAMLGLLASPLIPHSSSLSASQSQLTASQPPANTPAAAPAASAAPAPYAIPFRFEPNKGQADPNVKFLSRGRGYTLSLTATEAVVSLRKKSGDGQPIAMRMTLAGANPAPRIAGEAAQADTVNYVRGRDQNAWLTNIPTYARVRYHDVYPGVDVVYYHKGSDLEYDFVVAPGADPDRIRLAFSGADNVLNTDGTLVMRTPDGGELRQPAPVIYQEVNGERRTVSGGYALTSDRQIRFNLGAYDRSRPLVIDPVLTYSTYFGGSGEDLGWDVAVDANRNMYIVGTRPSAPGSQYADAFVAKYNAAGALLWVTHLGDSCEDQGRGIALDTAGNVYVTGQIGGACYPYPTLTNGAFAAKLTTNGAGIYMFPFSDEWSGADVGQAIAIDAAGNAYVGGVTSSQYFPTTALVFQPVYSGWYGDGFVVKVNTLGTRREYATYLGGTGHESLNDIAVDASGNVYVAGSTNSFDFPTTAGSFQPFHNGWGPMTTNGFVTKLNPTATALVYSTYLGGSLDDKALGITLDAARNLFITGSATSENFPTTPGVIQRFKAPQPECDALLRWCTDAFVTKLNAAGSGLVWSTYLGGNIDDAGSGIAIDPAGNPHITGSTFATNFPVFRPIQPTSGGEMDAFVTKLNATATAFIYSTYLGGGRFSSALAEGYDEGVRIAVDFDGANAYVVGSTRSPNFPVTPNAWQPVFGGGLCFYDVYRCADAFLAKISDAAAPAPIARDYAYTGPAVAIPDNQPGGVRIPLAVANFNGTIGDLNFRFDGAGCTAAGGATTVGLTHTWVGDLRVTLTSPAGTTVTLMNMPGGAGNAGDNFCQTVLDDEGGAFSIQNIVAGGAPYRGAFRPANVLTAFRGQNPNGTWFLTVSDTASQDIGTVRAFTLSVTAR